MTTAQHISSPGFTRELLREMARMLKAPELNTVEDVADFLDRCANGAARTPGELKWAMRRARDALYAIARHGAAAK